MIAQTPNPLNEGGGPMAEPINKTDKKRPVNNKNPRRGDPCPNKKCMGKLSSYSQSRTENGRIYFLSCARCNFKPKNNKEFKPF
ncbi:hypothetical protein [Gimesia aquarii]|uniref:Uncharacterized protein n=1 Tax=Gimesia aquarii TaxID=2527964 RepID=A0A517W3S5_9PLAN|nr:hypothetical protein [Gimesia aquarii]QDT99907.1 hypothetical protein V144x_54210 [Gimesia aquarii]